MKINGSVFLTLFFGVFLSSCSTTMLQDTRTGNISGVQEHIEDGEDINQKEEKFGNSLLHEAMIRGNTEMASHLIAGGIDPDLTDGKGMSHLMMAVGFHQNAIVKQLLDAGAHADYQDPDGFTALHLAAAMNNVEAMELILARTPRSLEVQDHFRRTPLMYAAFLGMFPTIQALLDAGASPDETTRENENPLHYYLNRIKGNNRKLPFNMAVFYTYSFQTIKNLQNRYRSMCGKILVERTGNLEIKNEEKQTALHVAFIEGYNDVVLQLLDKGADPDPIDIRGNSIIHLALMSNALYALNPDLLEIALDRSRHIDHQNSVGTTPLHLAVLTHKKQLVEKILRYHPRKDLRNNEGLTPMDLAQKNQYNDLIQLLQENSPVTFNQREKAVGKKG